MKSIFNKIQLRKLSQPMAWMLVIAIILISLNPAGFAFAVENDSDGWEVLYSLDTEESNENQTENEDGDIILSVQKGQEVFLTMQMLVNNEDNTKRFKDTFKLKVPGNIYDALVEENGEPGEWFESDLTESGYLLELRKTVASGSNARRRSRGTGSNARRRSRSSDSNAAEKFANDDIVELEFRFVKELRNERDPEDVEIDDMDFVIPFTAPESTVLVMSADRYDCEIFEADNTAMAAFGANTADGLWTCDWSISINGEPPEDISNVTINKDDKIEYKCQINIINPGTGTERFDSEFQISMPKVMYDMIVNHSGFSFEQPEWESSYEYPEDTSVKDVFAGVDVSENGSVVLLTYSFHDRFKTDKSESPDLDEAWFSFSFNVNENAKIVTDITEEGSEDSIVIGYEKTSPINIQADKEIAAVFKQDDLIQTNPTFIAETGDYVLYRIEVEGSKFEDEPYVIEPGDILDYFTERTYTYIDLNDPKNQVLVDDLVQKANDLQSATGAELAKGLKGEDDTSAQRSNGWKLMETPPPDYNPEAYHIVYENTEQITLTEESPRVSFYICLEVTGSSLTTSNLRNYMRLYHDDSNEKNDYTGPYHTAYHDVALDIMPTTIMRSSGSIPVRVGAGSGDDYIYPASINNQNLKLSDGDIVTFRVRYYDQGASPSVLTHVSFYLPAGLEMVDSVWVQAHPEYKFTTNSVSGTPNVSLDHPQHLLKDNNQITIKDERTPDEFPSYYKVTRYTYELPTPVIIKDSTAPRLFITCKVIGVDGILDKMNHVTPVDRAQAAKYGYLLSAEISGITNVDGTPVSDEDSFIDDGPFNDWINERTKAFKREGLYNENSTGATGEVNNKRNTNVRSLTGAYFPPTTSESTLDRYANQDEDDFDFTVIFPYEKLVAEESERLTKNLAEVTPAMNKKINTLLKEIDRQCSGIEGHESYVGKYTVIENGRLSKTQTIIPYVVTINADGSKIMNKVVFQDKLPDTMSFLINPATGEPVVEIYERIGPRLETVISEPGDSGSIIKSNESTLYEIKAALGDAYLKVDNQDFFEPSAVKNATPPHKWNCNINQAENVLTINFGDIKDNSYSITYLVVVEQMDFTYENNAQIKWETVEQKEVVDKDSFIVKDWDSSSGSRGHGKSISRKPDKDFITAGTIMLTPDECKNGVTLYYKLDLAHKGFRHPAGDINRRDYIMPLVSGDGTEIKPDVTVVDIVYNSIDDGKAFSAEYKEPYVSIKNLEEIKVDDQVDISVIIKVHYDQVPYGALIKNTFSQTTTAVAPLRVDLTKIDGANQEKALFNAKFKLTYADDTSVMTPAPNSKAVTFTTGTDGKASAEFYLDESKKEAGENYYYLILTETAAPDGYFKLGGLIGDPQTEYQIKLKVTVNNDGTYSYQAVTQDDKIFVLTTGANKQIELLIKNYREPLRDTSVTLRAVKNLNGRTQRDGEFEFEASLSSLPTGVTAEYGSSQPLAAGQSIPAVNGPNGSITFPEVTFKGVSAGDTAVFTLKETIPANPGSGITYSTATYVARITFMENAANGAMQASVAYYEQDGTTPVSADGVTFTNIYTPERPTPDPGGGNDGGNGGGGGGGGGNGGNRPSPTPPASIEDGDVPLGDVTEISDPVTPLAGLAKTWDDGIHPFGLLLIMLIAGAGIGIVLYLRKKQQD